MIFWSWLSQSLVNKTHVSRLCSLAGCLWGLIQLPLTSAKDPYLKPKESSEQARSQKQDVRWCHAFIFVINETKRFYYPQNSIGWKAVCGEDVLWLQVQRWQTCRVLLLLRKKILPILFDKIKLMPQGNFAKCTIYLNAFFWNSIVDPCGIWPELGPSMDFAYSRQQTDTHNFLICEVHKQRMTKVLHSGGTVLLSAIRIASGPTLCDSQLVSLFSQFCLDLVPQV